MATTIEQKLAELSQENLKKRYFESFHCLKDWNDFIQKRKAVGDISAVMFGSTINTGLVSYLTDIELELNRRSIFLAKNKSISKILKKQKLKKYDL